MNGHGEDDPVDVERDIAKKNFYFFVIPFSLSRRVVSSVLYSAVLGFKVVVKNKVRIAPDAAVMPEQESAGIDIDGVAVLFFRRIPAKACGQRRL